MTATNINAPDMPDGTKRKTHTANRIEWENVCVRLHRPPGGEKCLEIKGFSRTGFHAEYIDL